jgi:hypothetical protein
MALVYHGQGARYASAGLRATYGDTSKQAGALADQALAALFVRSVWTQERLAAVEGKKKSYCGFAPKRPHPATIAVGGGAAPAGA